MQNPRLLIVAIVGLIFAIGAGIIVSRNMPVNQLTPEDLAPVATDEEVKDDVRPDDSNGRVEDSGEDDGEDAPAVIVETKPATGGNTFTMAQVQTHNTPESCWAVVDESVYDLTTWIDRHPGGVRPIEGLCGTDATEKFTRKHGQSSNAKAALVLLKIGTLAQ